MKRLVVCLLAVAAISLSARDAAASEFSFDCISNNNATDCSVLESQMHVTIESTTAGWVDFTFTNEGSEASSITDVYFQDPPPLLGDPKLPFLGTGVYFTAKCRPGDLPGGSSYDFTTTYCADSNSPIQQNGVNPGDTLILSYALMDGVAMTDVLNAISAGTFSIGIHVQGFSGAGSETGILNPVPEPASILLLGSGAFAAALARRRRKIAA